MKWKPISLGGGPYVLSENGLAVKGTPTMAEAQAAGHFLSNCERRSQKWLGDWYLHIRKQWPDTYSQLIDAAGFNEESLRNFGWVAERVPAVNWKLDQGVGFSSHQAVASLSHNEQARILTKAAAKNLSLVEVRHEVRLVKRRTVVQGEGELAGAYRVIYCWPDYHAISLEALAKIPVAAHATKDAALFLRCPEPLRFDIKAVLDAWGFEHKRAFIWNTQVHGGADAYLSTRHEHLLWCVRGKMTPDRLTPMQDSIVTVRAEEDGRPPDRFYDIIEQLYDGPFLELFARAPREGWTTFGKTIGVKVA